MAERKKHKAAADTETVRPANDSVGATLRAARQAKGLEIDTVSQAIHIRSVQLKAIEDNNIESLPGMTYAVGFVRSYANYLGLNGAEIVHRFKAEHGHSSVSPQSKLAFPEPIAESRVPDPMMVGVGAFLAVVILVLWTIYANVHGGAKTADKAVPPAPVVTSVADSLSSSATAPATTAPTTTDQSAAAIVTTPATPAAPATTDTTTTMQPAVAVATPAPATTTEQQPPATTAAAAAPTTPAAAPPAETTPATAPAKEAKAAEDADSEDDTADDDTPKKADDDNGVINIKHGKSRITLKAREASWVQVSDGHEHFLYRKVLRPGEQYSVPDQPGLILDTANAGGLQVLVDGKKVSALGKDGDIMRGIALDPQELKRR